MKILLVTPVQDGSGETVTSLHLAESLVKRDHDVLFLASDFARRFVRERFADRIVRLGPDASDNVRAWHATIRDYRPDVVLFADYPLMFFPVGCAPLAREPGWAESLADLDALVVSMDHFGFGQRERGLYLGPPHLGSYFHEFVPFPDFMRVLLPCPMHEPSHAGRGEGVLFRYWDVPLKPAAGVRRQVRSRYLEDERGHLVFHSVSNWAWRYSAELGLSFYRHLPRILEYYFGGLPHPVTIVSINNGELLSGQLGTRVRFVNLGPVSKDEFEALLFGSDLLITENKLSISMGKAICGLQACAALVNSHRALELAGRLQPPLLDVVEAMERDRLGSVYPYAVYPTVTPADLDEIGLYRDNSLSSAFLDLEIFGAEQTAASLRGILTDRAEKEALRNRQELYVSALRELPDGTQRLEQMMEEGAGRSRATRSG